MNNIGSLKIPSIDDEAFDILGLTLVERKIIVATWKNARSTTAISRDCSVAPANIHHALKRLQTRGLIRHIKRTPSPRYRKVPSKTGGSWKSDVIRAIRSLQKLTGGRLS